VSCKGWLQPRLQHRCRSCKHALQRHEAATLRACLGMQGFKGWDGDGGSARHVDIVGVAHDVQSGILHGHVLQGILKGKQKEEECEEGSGVAAAVGGCRDAVCVLWSA
jgi:hypothetical protein